MRFYTWQESEVAPWGTPGRVAPTGTGYVAPAGTLEPVILQPDRIWPGTAVGAGALPVGALVPPSPAPAILPAVAPAVIGATPALGALGGVIGAGAALYGLAQLLGLGEGGGLFGINLLGGNGGFIPGTMIPLGGPGLPEPPAAMVAKEWSTGTAQFYMLIDGRIAVYSKKKRRWKVYRPEKMAVISKRLPSHRTLVRLKGKLDRHAGDALTILKLTRPHRLAKPQRRYQYYGRRK